MEDAKCSRTSAGVLFGVPLIEICGRMRVLVENHQGVIGYGCDEILVKVRDGCICIRGEKLTMNVMSKIKLVITGDIKGVELRRRG